MENKWTSESESEWALLARYVYTYEEFVFVTEASTVQQNDSDRTKNTDNKNREWGGLYNWFPQQSGLPSVVFWGQIWAELNQTVIEV